MVMVPQGPGWAVQLAGCSSSDWLECLRSKTGCASAAGNESGVSACNAKPTQTSLLLSPWRVVASRLSPTPSFSEFCFLSEGETMVI